MARGKTDYCAAHGGGVRCKAKGCYKIAVGSTNLCRLHGTAQQIQQQSVATTGVSAMPGGAAGGTGSLTSNLTSLVMESEKLARESLRGGAAVGGGGGSDYDSSDESDMDEAQVLYGRSAK